MLVTLATRTFTPEPTAAALRLGALARALAAGGERVRVLTARLAPSVARDAGSQARGQDTHALTPSSQSTGERPKAQRRRGRFRRERAGSQGD